MIPRVIPSMTTIPLALAMLACIASLQAAPQLTQDARTRLDTATDASSRLDESALYPLLDNAVAWSRLLASGEAWDEEEAHLLPYARLLEHPEDYRGGLALIGGKFVEAHTVQLNRPGPWGESAVRWAVLPRGAEETTVLILFPSGAGVPPTPWPGQEVRVRARFFKIWTDQRRLKPGEAATTQLERVAFPTFAAPGAAARVVDKGIDSPWNRGGGTGPVWVLIGALMLAGAGFAVVLWKTGRLPRVLPGMGAAAPLATRSQLLGERERRRGRDEEGDEEPPGPPLPEDPDEALAELERRREARAAAATDPSEAAAVEEEDSPVFDVRDPPPPTP